jgi:prepilin-type processing-associated H-X9-DG protein
MLMIDEREDSINDGYFSFLMGEPVIVDYPGAYHGDSSNINFADGHSEKKRWTDPRTVPALHHGQLIPLVVPSAENADLDWMQRRATSPAD